MSALAVLAAGPLSAQPAVSPAQTTTFPVLQEMPSLGELVPMLTGIALLTLVVMAVGAAIALPYRWYVRERVPSGLPVLIGLTIVATTIGTTGWLGQVIAGSDQLFSPIAIAANLSVFVVAGAGALAGVSIGDRLAKRLGIPGNGQSVTAVGGTLVKTVGRVVTVELPDDIGDVSGYDAVAQDTKDSLAGKTFVFPRRITIDELRERLTQRIKTDFAVGHVDMELAEDGSVEYLAVGSRAAGIGPTLPPETEAVAVRADPAFAASPGDLVQVWRPDPPERVVTAELRGVADDVVTLAVDAADVDKLDDRTHYKLVTLPVVNRPDREFASLLRAADETMGTVTVGAGSELEGSSLAALDVSVVAIASGDGQLDTLPRSERTLTPGEEVYAIATPEDLRKLEVAAGGPQAEGGDRSTPAGTDAATTQAFDEDDD